MLRKVLAAVFCLGLCLAIATADEFRGKVKKVDATGNSITIEDKDGKEHTFKISADTKFVGGKKDAAKELKGGIANKNMKEGATVVVTTKDGSKDQATEVRLQGGKKK